MIVSTRHNNRTGGLLIDRLGTMRSVSSSTSRRMIQRAASGTDEMIAPPVSRMMQRSASVSRAAFASASSSRLLQRIPSHPMGGAASSSCSSSQSPLLPVTVPLASSPSLRRHSSFQHRSNPTRTTKPFGVLQATFAVLAVACCTITFWLTTHKAHGTVHRNMEAFTVSAPLTSTKQQAVDRLPHVPEKAPILQLLRDAGILELDPETLESLPTWSDVMYVYCTCARARCECFCCKRGSPLVWVFVAQCAVRRKAHLARSGYVSSLSRGFGSSRAFLVGGRNFQLGYQFVGRVAHSQLSHARSHAQIWQGSRGDTVASS
jgi:hypothetical protein